MDTLIYIAILPVALIWFYIYKKDRNKESKKLLSKLFLSGMASSVIVLFVSEFLSKLSPIFAVDTEGLDSWELAVNIFIGVALVEECSKWLMLRSIAYDNQEFDELYDMIIYGVSVALGFALLENILYVLAYGVKTGFLRGILAVPGHACYGIFMGCCLGKAKKGEIEGNKRTARFNLFWSIFFPTVLHGIYDYCLVSNDDMLILVFFIFVIALDIGAIKKVKKVARAGEKLNSASEKKD